MTMAMYPSKSNTQTVLRSAVLAVAATVGCTSGVDRAVTSGEALKLKMIGKKLNNNGSTFTDTDISRRRVWDNEAEKKEFFKHISTFKDPVTYSINLAADTHVVYGSLKKITARPYVGTLGDCMQVMTYWSYPIDMQSIKKNGYGLQDVKAYHCSPTGFMLHQNDFTLRNADGTLVKNPFTDEIKIKNTYVKDIDFNQNGKTEKHFERHALRTYERSELIQYLEEEDRKFVKRETELKQYVDEVLEKNWTENHKIIKTEMPNRDESETHRELTVERKMLVDYLIDDIDISYLDVTEVLGSDYSKFTCRKIIEAAKKMYRDKNAPVINLPGEDLPISRDLLSSLKAENGLRRRSREFFKRVAVGALRSVKRIF